MRYKREAIFSISCLCLCFLLALGANYVKMDSDVAAEEAFLSQEIGKGTTGFSFRHGLLKGIWDQKAYASQESDDDTADSTVVSDIETGLSQRSNYKSENLSRYTEYLKANPQFSFGKVVTDVNMNLDKPFYSDIKTIENPDDTLVLVNKYNKLPDGYVPPDYSETDGRVQVMRKEAQEHFEAMADDAANNGCSLWICSGYRSYDVQKDLYIQQQERNPNEYDLYQAKEGHSEHQTGLAADFNSTSLSFQYSNEFAYLKENAHKFGFILRYPAEKTEITGYAFEPWHWRYVGVDVATTIKNDDIVFEEYVASY